MIYKDIKSVRFAYDEIIRLIKQRNKTNEMRGGALRRIHKLWSKTDNSGNF